MFPNVDVLNQARLIYQRKEALAQQATASVPKPICKKIDENGKEFEADTFDVRHPTDIAALVIDTGSVPPDQRDEYFLEEARKLTLAFYTIDEKTTDIRVIAKSALPKYEEDEKKQYAISGLIQAYYFQLMDLVEDYYEFLDVKVIEREI